MDVFKTTFEKNLSNAYKVEVITGNCNRCNESDIEDFGAIEFIQKKHIAAQLLPQEIEVPLSAACQEVLRTDKTKEVYSQAAAAYEKKRGFSQVDRMMWKQIEALEDPKNWTKQK
eukprot:Platyproteum_vivax@DN24_c0_g1_i1.p1